MHENRRALSRWVTQCFRDRGIKGLTALEIEQALQVMGEPILLELLERMHRIAAGTEVANDIICAKDQIAQHIPRSAPTFSQSTAAKIDPVHSISTVSQIMAAESQPSLDSLASEFPSERTLDKTQLRAFGHHAYGSKAVLKIELDLVKPKRNGLLPRHTVQIEIAPIVNGVRNRYDWSRKIPFQFTQDELPVLSATLLGLMPGPLRFTNHGPDANKTLMLEYQKTGWFLKLSEGSTKYPIQLDSGDIHAWAGLCLTALKRNYGELDGQMHAMMLKAVARMHNPVEGA